MVKLQAKLSNPIWMVSTSVQPKMQKAVSLDSLVYLQFPFFLGGASGGVLGVFGGVFTVVFGQCPGRIFEANSRF